jgi:cysteine-rich repeat protein
MRMDAYRVAASVVAVAFAAAVVEAGEVTRVSVTSAGSQANATSVSASNRALSADSRFVVFQSSANDLVPGDTNGVEDIFVHDRETGSTRRVSLAAAGTQATRASLNPAISHDGRIVAFDNLGALVSGDTNAAGDVFVRDLVAGTTTRASVATGGGQANRGSLAPALSGDGRLVAFESGATNLVPGDSNARKDVFVHDRAAVTTVRVSLGPGGVQGNGDSSAAALAASAALVAFESLATNLVPGDTNGVADVFVRDLTAGVTSRVSVASDGTQANARSGKAVMSADGSLVAFESLATNLVPDDSNGTSDIFVHDRATGTTTRVSVGPGGTQGSGASFGPALSMDGRYVLFESEAPDLVPGDTNDMRDVFLHDRATGMTRRMGRADVQALGMSFAGALSPDGHAIVFDSVDANLVPADTNNARDVFVETPACGDGMGDVDEACDDGNLIDGDGCDSNCTPTGCGNTIVTAGETCDDGNLIDGDGCDSNCTPTGCGNTIVTAGEMCDDGDLIDGDGCDSNCTPTGCGNTIVTAGETCDDGDLIDGDGCDSNCTPTGCGNTIVTAGETCDDGNLVSGDGCDPNCAPTGCGNGFVTVGEDCDDGNQDDADACPNDCILLRCGDGIVRDREACDDGNLTDGDGCDSNCTPTGCGNTIITTGEQCDDGDLIDGDGCDSNCTPTGCGNAVVTSGETCDDGNLTSGDGCDANCTPTGCGNAVVTTGETCDDGNLTSGDGCDENCTPTACGNAILTSGETCDDGNLTSGDGCDENCTPTGCGNAVATSGEECDDGNALDDDGCEADCRLTVCAGGVPIEKPVIRILNLGPPLGDEDIVFSGVLRMERGLLAPMDEGAQVLIEDLGAGRPRVLALTHATMPIPPGGPGSGCGKGDGWKANRPESQFMYRNRSGAIDSPTCTAGSAAGLDSLELQAHGNRIRPVAFRVEVRNTTVERPVGPLRAMLVLGASAEASMAGRCGRHEFACEYNYWRSVLTCK